MTTTAVAKKMLKPVIRVRPPAPGQVTFDAHPAGAGRPYRTAVASGPLMPRSGMRPRAPGHATFEAHWANAGCHYSTNCGRQDESETHWSRATAEPGQLPSDAPKGGAGLT